MTVNLRAPEVKKAAFSSTDCLGCSPVLSLKSVELITLHISSAVSTITHRLYNKYLEESTVARKPQSGEVSISDHLRALLQQNPQITAPDATATLAYIGIKLKASLVY